MALMAERTRHPPAAPAIACWESCSGAATCGRRASQGDVHCSPPRWCRWAWAILSNAGIVDIAEPLLERLAQKSGELVRLSIIDEDRLTWIAKSQGTRQGLRYDPDMGMDARLSCTASGHAWLLTLSDERALELVSRQGFGLPKDYGPKAPTTVKALLAMLEQARSRGFAMIDEVFAPGMSAMAAPVMRGREAIGVISIAGPRQRLTVARMQALAPALLAATAELGPISRASTLFGRPPLGKS